MTSPAMSEAIERPATLSERTVATARGALAGRHGGCARRWPSPARPLLPRSPTWIREFRDNIQAGAKYGYACFGWCCCQRHPMLFQGFRPSSASSPAATSLNCAATTFPGGGVADVGCQRNCRHGDRSGRVLGGAIGLSFCCTCRCWRDGRHAIVTYGLLMCQKFGFRPLEIIIGSIVGIICLCYVVEMFIVRWIVVGAFSYVTPQLADAEALLLAVGIIGATVMPHAIYLHSGLTQARVPVHDDNDRRMVLKFSNREVVIALTVAGVVKMAMVMMASARSTRPSEVAESKPLSHPDAAARRRGGRRVFDFADCLGRLVVDSRHHGRQMIMQASSASAFPSGCAGSSPWCRLRRRRARRQRDQCARDQSGGLEPGAATADDFAHHLHQRPDIMAGSPTRADARCRVVATAWCSTQCGFDCADFDVAGLRWRNPGLFSAVRFVSVIRAAIARCRRRWRPRLGASQRL